MINECNCGYEIINSEKARSLFLQYGEMLYVYGNSNNICSILTIANAK